MKLVEVHNIKRGHKYFQECDSLCRQSKLLYNEANYTIRQSFIKDGIYISSIELKKQFQKQSDNYYKLPTKVSSGTLLQLHRNWLSFFKSIKDWKKNPTKYHGRPELPRYKKVYFPTIYDRQAISTRYLKKNIIKLSQTNIEIPYQHTDNEVKQARIIPINSELFKIEIIYEKEIVNHDLNKNNSIAIDFGINNLCSVVGDNINPTIITGKPVKSFNQYYNKKKAKLQSKLKKGTFASKNIKKLSNKRNNKINDYFHKSSKLIIDYCLTNDIRNIVVGYNKGWKQNINIGKRNNQKFVNIPFYKLLNMIKYKAKLNSINVIEQEESYTSKCSWLDNEEVKKHENYLGKRIKRGLFKTKNGIFINADVNAAANILRKSNSQFHVLKKGVEVVSAMPIRINPYKQFSIDYYSN